MKKFKKTIDRRPSDKALDKLWRECCLARDKHCIYTKEIYGATLTRNDGVLQVHHIMKKATNRLRWDLDNGITITKGVHFSIAHSPKPIVENQFRQWALDRLPVSKQKMLALAASAKSTGYTDKIALKMYLEKKLSIFNDTGEKP